MVQFLGVVSHDVVPTLLAAADVAVAPSVHDEAGNVDGLPNTVMEMMASATPLVATPAGGIGAVATDGVTARLVAERDVRALASAIDELLRDRTAAAHMGPRARESRVPAPQLGARRRGFRGRLPTMLSTIASLIVVAYLPGAVVFRLPYANRDKRATLPAEERLFWAVIISILVTTTLAFVLAAMSVVLLAHAGVVQCRGCRSLWRWHRSATCDSAQLLAGWAGLQPFLQR